MMDWQHQVAITALITFLIEIIEHYFPWRMLLRRDLPRLAAYVLGVSGLVVPLSLLLLLWIDQYHVSFPIPDAYLIPASQIALQSLVAVWATVLAGAIAVLGAYILDWLMGRINLAEELTEILEQHDAKR